MSDAINKAFAEWCAACTTFPAKTTDPRFLRTVFEAGWQARDTVERQFRGLDGGVEPAFFGDWVPPRDNPNHKLFKPKGDDE